MKKIKFREIDVLVSYLIEIMSRVFKSIARIRTTIMITSVLSKILLMTGSKVNEEGVAEVGTEALVGRTEKVED